MTWMRQTVTLKNSRGNLGGGDMYVGWVGDVMLITVCNQKWYNASPCVCMCSYIIYL